MKYSDPCVVERAFVPYAARNGRCVAWMLLPQAKLPEPSVKPTVAEAMVRFGV